MDEDEVKCECETSAKAKWHILRCFDWPECVAFDYVERKELERSRVKERMSQVNRTVHLTASGTVTWPHCA